MRMTLNGVLCLTHEGYVKIIWTHQADAKRLIAEIIVRGGRAVATAQIKIGPETSFGLTPLPEYENDPGLAEFLKGYGDRTMADSEFLKGLAAYADLPDQPGEPS